MHAEISRSLFTIPFLSDFTYFQDCTTVAIRFFRNWDKKWQSAARQRRETSARGQAAARELRCPRRPETRARVSAFDMSESPTSNQPPDADYELLPVGLPAKGGGPGGGAGSGETPSNAKFDPRWAERAASQLMDTTGLRAVEVQQTIAELRKTQAAVSRSLGETKEAVLWLQKLEVLEQQLVAVPEYKEKAKRIVAEMASLAARVAKAKRRAAKLSGVEFPDYDGTTGDDGATGGR